MLIYAIINVYYYKLFVIESNNFLRNSAQTAINISVCHTPQTAFPFVMLRK